MAVRAQFENSNELSSPPPSLSRLRDAFCLLDFVAHEELLIAISSRALMFYFRVRFVCSFSSRVFSFFFFCFFNFFMPLTPVCLNLS